MLLDDAMDLTSAAGRLCPRCGDVRPQSAAICPADGASLVDDRRGLVVADRYQVGSLIGIGGMGGTVWAAEERPFGRPVAVKIVPATHFDAARRFERGARLMGSMCHPNITTVHAWGALPDACPYLVMERLHGMPLDRLLERGPLDLRRALHITVQLLAALEHVHAHGVIHRDVKPANVFLVTAAGSALVKLVDFGIARRIEVGVGRHAPVTRQDRICGTPEYMAPEQVLAARSDGRVDLYAVGVTLFRMVSGRLPFNGPARRMLYAAKTRAVAPRLADVMPADVIIPESVEDLVARALARDPDERFASAQAMRRATRRAFEDATR